MCSTWKRWFIFNSVLAVALATASSAPAAQYDCGQPVSTGLNPTASDSLYTLRTAIGISTCDLAVCDVDASCSVTATDALRVLSASIGQGIQLSCEGGCFSTTSTTLASAPTWTDVMSVFAINGCANNGCHGGNGEAGGLSGLDDSSTGYDELLSDPVSCRSSSYASRVVAGDPAASFLLAKLEGVADCGGQMPPVGAPIWQEDRDLIRDWILAGAPID